MQRNFMAEIHINAFKNEKNPVKIMPFYDRDKDIAMFLQKILNHELHFDNDVDKKNRELNFSMMKDLI